ncbi:hypothetical protein GLW08_03170 [Pontibacillus yanchengensis]|uniref:Uncharacterized protein n=2 Tax=Pontibacillus yanchengensis TaxID=462910 RepID=A0ACC7VDV6_9BACI|nr:hypothetical protein [Pontibacillus yanchengensis]MYL34681.1 hypothetical protein [Pontibacillus yanchengensis]MYL52334.1 hypothetical protein [Pontibacillus yanchengensis]
MNFKVIAFYNGATEITFEMPSREEVLFCDYYAAKCFVNSLKEQHTYHRYQFQIVDLQGKLLPPIKSQGHSMAFIAEK